MEKTMFEIYRENEYNRRYRVIYFTELSEQNKEFEINRALSGEHFLDGFLDDATLHEAKERIQILIDQMNTGVVLTPDDVQERLGAMLANDTHSH